MKRYWQERAPATREEIHFGRRLRCFVDRPAGLHAMFAAAVAAEPGREALVCDGTRLTYAELDALVARCANGMRRRGIGRGDRVALLLGNRSEFMIAFFATARLGAIVVPLNIREQRPELLYVLGHSGAALLITEPDLIERLPEPAELPLLKHRLFVGDKPPGEPFAALLDADAVCPPLAVADEDVAAILYTSGTTGRPKGAMLTHLGLVHSALHFRYAFGLSAADRALVAVPMSHVTGAVALVVAIVSAGGTLAVLPQFKAADFLALMARERISYTLIVPAMYNLCLLQEGFDSFDLSAWRIGGFGGAPMPLPTIERFAQRLPKLQLINAYGATETTSPATIMPAQFGAAHLDSVGLPVACGEICVMDDEGKEVPPGTTGEIWIRGPMVVKGYWQDEAATAREISDGYWHSGDIGDMDADGFVRILDRKKDMINRGGYKVFTAEVESVLLAHPQVVEAAVIGVPCPVLGERVHAFVVTREPAPDAAALRALCASHLSDYKVPESIHLRSDPLPRNANGKLLKRMLKESASDAGR